MDASTGTGQMTGAADEANVRELFRACGNFLEAVEAEAGLTSRTRLAASGMASALRRVVEAWPRVARDWHEVGRRGTDVQYQLQGLERQVGEIYRIMAEEEEWPTLL